MRASCLLSPLRSGLCPRLQLSTPHHRKTPQSVRFASHQAQGRANGVKNGAGRRLGAKKTGGQQVVPGNIIFRQRGTHWFPGENCGMGRDHTIHATAPGFVTYYRDPRKHPKRQYIGVVFDRTQTLPTPPNAARRRRLGMVAVLRKDLTTDVEDAFTDATPSIGGPGAESSGLLTSFNPGEGNGRSKRQRAKPVLEMKSNYMFRESNWQIGQTAEREGIAQRVKPFKPGDRWAAWRKATERRARNAERRAMGKGKKKSKK